MLVSSFQQDPSAKGVETALGFDFAKIALTDQPVAKNGTLGTPETSGWDLLQNKTDAVVATSDIAASAATTSDTSAATDFRRVNRGPGSGVESAALLPEG